MSTVKKSASENREWDNLKTVSKMTLGLLDMFSKQPYMAKKPNANTAYEDALSIQTLSAINVTLLIVHKEEMETIDYKLTDLIAKAMFLRALIEITANINYFSLHVEDEKLAERFQETASQSIEAIHNMKKFKSTRYANWARKSIRQRIQLLENESNGMSYLNTYSYLSSFVHSDAGYLTTTSQELINALVGYISAITLSCLTNIEGSLQTAGVLLEADRKFIEAIAKSLDIELMSQPQEH